MKKVAIIGAGLGGLVAGNLLAKKGHEVTLYESHTAPGGYTAGFRRKGFYFEGGTLSLESSATFTKALEDIGVNDQVRLTRKRDRMLSPHFDFELTSFAAFRESLAAAFPAEKKNLADYFAALNPLCDALRPFINRISPVLFTGPRKALALIPFLVKGGHLMRLWKTYQNVTSAEFTGRFIPAGTPLYRFLVRLGYADSSVIAMAGLFTSASDDYWCATDGFQQLADVLAAQFQKNGGDLRLATPVTRIVTRGGRAAGVEAGGALEEADYIISSSDFKRTFTELLDDPSLVPADELGKIRTAAVSEGVFTVFLGLAMSGAELVGHMKLHGVLYGTYDRDYDPRDTKDPDLFAKTSVSLHSPSLINPALAPEGKSSLMLMTMAPAGWQGRWGGGDRERYRELKRLAMDALITKAEAVVPGLRARIEVAEAATPLTYERYTGNTDGATSAWSWDPHKRFYEKGTLSLVVDTPIPNLFIGSCWASQIGGVPSAIGAGYMCARRIR